MSNRKQPAETPLSALLISPDRAIAEGLMACSGAGLQMLADLKVYPPRQTLEIRLRQLKPEVVLIDVATDFEAAAEIIRSVLLEQPPVQVVGLHRQNDSESILGALRLGATEFLYLPFDEASVRDAAERLRRLRAPDPDAEVELGRVVCFASAKPGSGASTLATQAAFALRRATGKRVLLIDADVMGGTIGFCLKLSQTRSLLDALEMTEGFDKSSWSGLTVNHGGVDVLPAPEVPRTYHLDPVRLHEVLEFARTIYDWVVLDLPTLFQRLSLLAVSEADESFLVSTTELPSLHLTRRAVNLLRQLGIANKQFRIVLNRAGKKEGLGGSDIEKIFNSPVYAKFPNDYFSLHRVVTLGQPLDGDTELGRSIDALVAKLAGAPAGERKKGEALMEPALSQR